MNNVITIIIIYLRKHVMGDAPVMLQYLSEPSVDFSHCHTKSVNYEVQNILFFSSPNILQIVFLIIP